MALPLIPLAARAALSLAKNKKAREALTKPVGQFLKRRSALEQVAKASSDAAKALPGQLRRASRKSPSAKALTGFPGGLGIGAGTATVMTDKKSQKPKKATGKPDVYGGTSKKRKMKPKKFK
jgi:hypothetical protein